MTRNSVFILGGLVLLPIGVISIFISNPFSESGFQSDEISKKASSVYGPDKIDPASLSTHKSNVKSQVSAETSRSFESAATRLANFLSTHTDIDERSNFSDQLIAELCNEGKSQEALDLIDKNLGQLHDSGLYTFFLKVQLDQNEILNLIKKQDDRDMAPVLHGYFGRFKKDELISFLKSPSFNDFFREKKTSIPQGVLEDAIASSLAGQLEDRSRDEVISTLTFITDLAENGTILKWNAYDLVTKNKTLTSFQKWDLLKELGPKDQDNDPYYAGQSTESRRTLIDSIVRSDANRAMEQILLNKTPEQFFDIQKAIASWTNIDSGGATDWYQKNQLSISQPEKNAIAFAFSEAALNSLEFDGAGSWAYQIQDPALRETALKAVTERKAEYDKAVTPKL